MSSFAESLLTGTVVRIETTALPTFEVDVANAALGEQGLATKLLRPRITVLKNGQPIFSQTPAGPPEEGFPFKIALAGLALVVLLLLVTR